VHEPSRRRSSRRGVADGWRLLGEASARGGSDGACPSLIEDGGVSGLHRVMTGLDTDSIEMREVSPMRGLLSQQERTELLGLAG
jgi:hypothetical protein